MTGRRPWASWSVRVLVLSVHARFRPPSPRPHEALRSRPYPGSCHSCSEQTPPRPSDFPSHHPGQPIVSGAAPVRVDGESRSAASWRMHRPVFARTTSLASRRRSKCARSARVPFFPVTCPVAIRPSTFRHHSSPLGEVGETMRLNHKIRLGVAGTVLASGGLLLAVSAAASTPAVACQVSRWGPPGASNTSSAPTGIGNLRVTVPALVFVTAGSGALLVSTNTGRPPEASDGFYLMSSGRAGRAPPVWSRWSCTVAAEQRRELTISVKPERRPAGGPSGIAFRGSRLARSLLPSPVLALPAPSRRQHASGDLRRCRPR